MSGVVWDLFGHRARYSCLQSSQAPPPVDVVPARSPAIPRSRGADRVASPACLAAQAVQAISARMGMRTFLGPSGLACRSAAGARRATPNRCSTCGVLTGGGIQVTASWNFYSARGTFDPIGRAMGSRPVCFAPSEGWSPSQVLRHTRS